MEFFDANITSVYRGFSPWSNVDARCLEQREVMSLPVCKSRTDDLSGCFVHYDLPFQGVAFLFSGIVFFLPLFGRSIGVSVASIKTVSY